VPTGFAQMHPSSVKAKVNRYYECSTDTLSHILAQLRYELVMVMVIMTV